jgi:hypothetical protein
MKRLELLDPTIRTNPHLRDIILTTGAEVEFPTEDEVDHELLLKRIYSVAGNYIYNISTDLI